MRSIVLIVHNIRSAYNVGSILRTCEGLGVNKVYLSGYTPYPSSRTDKRLPHEAAKVDKQIQKTALGAENSIEWLYEPDIKKMISELAKDGYQIIGLEQTKKAIKLSDFKPAGKVALICGSEIGGLPNEVIAKCDQVVQIPMLGQKESFNVAVACAIALYHLHHL